MRHIRPTPVPSSSRALGVLAGGRGRADKVRVVASSTDLKALTEAVGGDLVEVDSLARGTQNPHDIEVRPSLMVKLRRADLLVVNGVERDPWVDVVVQGAQNARGLPRRPGLRRRLRGHPGPRGATARWTARGATCTRSAIRTTPSIPAMAPAVTANIVEGLERVAPEHRAAFERNRRAVPRAARRGHGAVAEDAGAVRGAKVVVPSRLWPYFLTRFGLVLVGRRRGSAGHPAVARPPDASSSRS